jgi:lipopolysaccharide assembly protein A
MQIFLWLAFVIAIGVAVFAVQNSTAPAVILKFLVWNFETSLVYAILLSIGAGMLIMLLLWVPFAIRSALRVKNLRREVGTLERSLKIRGEETRPETPA